MRDYQGIADFLRKVESIIEKDIWLFVDNFTWAFQALVSVTDATKNRSENSKELSNRVARVRFENLFDDLRRQATLEAAKQKRRSQRNNVSTSQKRKVD